MNEELCGVVIRASNYKDADKIVTILTDKNGKITASARGVRRKNSKIAPAVQLFCYSTFELFSNGLGYTINDAQVSEQFIGLRSDITKMSLASYICELLGTQSEDEVEDNTLLRVVLNTFYAIETEKCSQAQIKAAFEIKYAQICGYMPNLRGCKQCETSEKLLIDIDGGSLCCPACSKCVTGVPIDRDSLLAIKYVLASDAKKMFSFKISGISMEYFSNIAEKYILTKMERKFKTLEIYKQMSEK